MEAFLETTYDKFIFRVKTDYRYTQDEFWADNTCYFMMVVWAAERFKLNLVSLHCEAEGEVEEFLDRTSWFKKVVLRPRLVVKGSTPEIVQRALAMALKYSTINQSFKSEVVIQPEILIRQADHE